MYTTFCWTTLCTMICRRGLGMTKCRNDPHFSSRLPLHLSQMRLWLCVQNEYEHALDRVPRCCES